jgi:hypothetical protein
VTHSDVPTSIKLGLVFSALAFASGCLGAPDGETDEVERAVAPLSASGTCQGVRFGITNEVEGATAIRVRKIEHLAVGAWRSDEMASVRIPAGERVILPPQDLEGVEGEVLTQVRVHHDVRAPSGWYDAGFQEIVLTGERPCQDYNAKEITIDKTVPWQ